MRRVFGDQSMKEEGAIKTMLYLFTGTYTVRVAFATVMHYNIVWVEDLFANDNKLFTLGLLGLWVAWDIIPLGCMFIIHYKNFNSFSEEEVLYTEYSIDDNRTTVSERMMLSGSDKGSLLLAEGDNLLETSGIINLESDPESSSSSGDESDK